MNQVAREYEDGLISVITPVHNASKYLRRMIESVLSQTYHNIEMVFVDDCSTDSSAAIIKEYQVNNSGIRYHLLPKNMGAGVARNKALEIATGRYVAFLDADDEWERDKIERQVALLKETGGSFCFTAIKMIDGDDNIIKGKRKIKEQIDYKFLLSNTMIPTSSVLVDRQIKGDFRMHLRRGGQDYATWLKLLRDGSTAYGIDEALTNYRIDGESLSSNKFKSIKQIWEIQTKDEGINKVRVVCNIVKWGWNAVKKYYL